MIIQKIKIKTKISNISNNRIIPIIIIDQMMNFQMKTNNWKVMLNNPIIIVICSTIISVHLGKNNNNKITAI